jgi:hypothetical protein
MVQVDQITLAKGAAGKKLDGIHAAHVGLNHCHNFLVLGVGADFSQGHLGCPDANGKSRAHVAVKSHCLFNHLLIDVFLLHLLALQITGAQ